MSLSQAVSAMPAVARQFVALAHHALVELLRAPFFGLVLVGGLLLAALLPALDYLSFLEKRRLVADSLLALLWAAGAVTAGLGAGAVVGDDLRRGAAPLVWTKPLGRPLWLVGRWAGLAAALTLLWLLFGTATLWGSRIAYHDYWPDWYAVGRLLTVVATGLLVGGLAHLRFGRSYAQALALALILLLPLGFVALGEVGFRGHGREGWTLVDLDLLQPVLLALPALWLGAAVAVLAALALEAVPALAATVAVLLAGLWLSGPTPWPVRLLVPGFGSLWLAGEWPAAEAGRAALASLLQTAGLLCLGAGALGRRELS